MDNYRKKIEKIKSQIMAMGDVRPGSISKQFSVCGKPGCKCGDKKNPQKHGPYYKLSYRHRGDDKSEFIRAEFKKSVEQEIKNYAKLKELINNWVDLVIESSKQKRKLAKS